MNNIPEEDLLIIDAFLFGSSDFFVGQNLRFESKDKTASLIERSTSTVIARIDFTNSVSLVKMRMNFIGYEFLPAYLETKGFMPRKSAQKGILEFNYYKLDGYAVQETSINTLWKSFRKLIAKNKHPKIFYESDWHEIMNIVHEDFTYVIKMRKMSDLTIAVLDLMMIWAEPVEDIPVSSDSFTWGTGLMAEEKTVAPIPISSSLQKAAKSSLPYGKNEELTEKIEIVSRDLRFLQEYVEQLFSFISEDKKSQVKDYHLLVERVSFLEKLSIEIKTLSNLEPLEDSNVEPIEQQIHSFNLTTDSSRFEESVSSVTSLMMPLN